MQEEIKKTEEPKVEEKGKEEKPVNKGEKKQEGKGKGEKKQEGKKSEEKKGDKPQKGKVELRTPKGTKDYNPVETKIREEIFDTIKRIFKLHGAVGIETPVFELKSTLMGKYGEDQKLIFDLADQGGDICCLRYDLTVPFARYLVENKVLNIKKYQIGRVYRRDQPSINQGRLREFYQCDFDIAGEYSPMLPDAECLAIMSTILTDLKVGKFKIKINNRKILDGIFQICGVPKEKFLTICSSIDKLDKMTWEQVREEMTKEKGLDGEIADKLQKFVEMKGNPLELLQKIEESKVMAGNSVCENALKDMKLLFEYCGFFNVLDTLVFDLSLARGLNYYTGIIFEAILTDSDLAVGSIGGGGRYDNLTQMFSKLKVPCIGFSVGVERIFAVLMHQMEQQKIKASPCYTQVYVASPDGRLKERMEIATELWKNGISAEFMLKTKPSIKQQLSYADENGLLAAVIIGGSELEKGVVQIKDLKKQEQREIPRDKMIEEIKAIIQRKD